MRKNTKVYSYLNGVNDVGSIKIKNETSDVTTQISDYKSYATSLCTGIGHSQLDDNCFIIALNSNVYFCRGKYYFDLKQALSGGIINAQNIGDMLKQKGAEQGDISFSFSYTGASSDGDLFFLKINDNFYVSKLSVATFSRLDKNKVTIPGDIVNAYTSYEAEQDRSFYYAITSDFKHRQIDVVVSDDSLSITYKTKTDTPPVFNEGVGFARMKAACSYHSASSKIVNYYVNHDMQYVRVLHNKDDHTRTIESGAFNLDNKNLFLLENGVSRQFCLLNNLSNNKKVVKIDQEYSIKDSGYFYQVSEYNKKAQLSKSIHYSQDYNSSSSLIPVGKASTVAYKYLWEGTGNRKNSNAENSNYLNLISNVKVSMTYSSFAGKEMKLSDTSIAYKEENKSNHYTYKVEECTSVQDTTTYSLSKILERNPRGNITLEQGTSELVKNRYMYAKAAYTTRIPIATLTNINITSSGSTLKYDASYIGFEVFEAFTHDVANKKMDNGDLEITQVVSSTESYVGDACAKFDAAGSVRIKSGKMNLVQDKAYLFSYWLKADDNSQWQYHEHKFQKPTDGLVKNFSAGNYIDQLCIRPIDSSLLINVYDSETDNVIAMIGDRGDTVFHIIDRYDMVPFSFKNKLAPVDNSTNSCNILNKVYFDSIHLNGIYRFNGFNIKDNDHQLTNKYNSAVTVDVFGDGHIVSNVKSAVDFASSSPSFALSGYHDTTVNQEFTVRLVDTDTSKDVRFVFTSRKVQLQAGLESKEVEFIHNETRWFIVVFREIILLYFNNKQVASYRLSYRASIKRVEVQKEGQSGNFLPPLAPTSDTLNDQSNIFIMENIAISSGYTDLSGNVIQTQALTQVGNDLSTKIVINGSVYGGYGQKIISTLNALIDIGSMQNDSNQKILVYRDDFIRGTLQNSRDTPAEGMEGYLMTYYDQSPTSDFAFPADENNPIQRYDYTSDPLHRMKSLSNQGENRYTEQQLYNQPYAISVFKDLYGSTLHENIHMQSYTERQNSINTNSLYDAEDYLFGVSRYVDGDEQVKNLYNRFLSIRSDDANEVSLKYVNYSPNYYDTLDATKYVASKEVRKYGRLVTTESVDSGSKSIISDIFGLTRLIVLNDYEKTIYYKYDKQNRLKECGTVVFTDPKPSLPQLVLNVDDPNYPTTGTTVSYRYTYDYGDDGTSDIMYRGRLVKIEDLTNSVTTTYKYDSLGHKVETKTNNKAIQYEFNNKGIVTKETYPFTTPLQLSYMYDDFKRLNKIVKLDTNNAVVDTYLQDCIYDMYNRLTYYKQHYGITKEMKYDFYQNVKEINWTREVDANNSVTLLKQQFEYCYDHALDENGNITYEKVPYFYQNHIYKLTETSTLTGTEQTTVKTYDYDYLYKFINESGKFSKYYYDNNGNLSFKDGKLYILKDGKNQIEEIIDHTQTTVTYNSFGDVGKLSLDNQDTHTFTWDPFFVHSFAECRMTDKTVAIKYDYTGNRWKKEVKDTSNTITSSQEYYYGLYNYPSFTIDKDSKMTANIYLFDNLALQIQDVANAQPVVYVADHAGSIRVGQNGIGTVDYLSFQYDEFGSLVGNFSTKYPPYMFANMEYDSELLMYNHNGNLYHPGHGVYLSYTRGNGNSPYVFV